MRAVKVFALFGRPEVLRRVHAWATWFWLVMAPVSMLTDLKNSVPYLVGLSVYAIVTGHWSSWQACRVEVRQDEESEARDSNPAAGHGAAS